MMKANTLLLDTTPGYIINFPMHIYSDEQICNDAQGLGCLSYLSFELIH